MKRVAVRVQSRCSASYPFERSLRSAEAADYVSGVARLRGRRDHDLVISHSKGERWIESPPASTRQIYLGPGMQAAIRRPGVARLVTADESCGQSRFTAGRHEQPSPVSASAFTPAERFLRRVRLSALSDDNPNQTMDALVERSKKSGSIASGVLKRLLCKRAGMSRPVKETGQCGLFGVRKTESIGPVEPQEIEGVPTQRVRFEPGGDAQLLAQALKLRMRGEASCRIGRPPHRRRLRVDRHVPRHDFLRRIGPWSQPYQVRLKKNGSGISIDRCLLAPEFHRFPASCLSRDLGSGLCLGLWSMRLHRRPYHYRRSGLPYAQVAARPASRLDRTYARGE